MDFALAQLALVFLPGIIWANIDAKFGAGLRPQQTTLVIRAFLFGLSTYAVLFVIYGWIGKPFGYENLDLAQQNIDLSKLRDEIAWSIPLAFFLAIAWLYIVRFRLLMRFLNLINATA